MQQNKIVTEKEYNKRTVIGIICNIVGLFILGYVFSSISYHQFDKNYKDFINDGNKRRKALWGKVISVFFIAMSVSYHGQSSENTLDERMIVSCIVGFIFALISYFSLNSKDKKIPITKIQKEEIVFVRSDCGKQYFKSDSWIWMIAVVVPILAVVLIAVLSNNQSVNNNNDREGEGNNISSSTTSPYYSELGITYSHYIIATMVADNVDVYCEYMAELKNVATKGTYSDVLKKEKAIEYINNLPLSYGLRIILFRIQFPEDNTYNSDIVEYLNERNDITYEDIVFILEELGFAVFEDGTVKW